MNNSTDKGPYMVTGDSVYATPEAKSVEETPHAETPQDPEEEKKKKDTTTEDVTPLT